MKVYEVVSPLVEQNSIHNPSFNYENLVRLITELRDADPSDPGARTLDSAFNSNDTILFLGALGAAELPGAVDFDYAGGDADTEIPGIDMDPNMDPNVAGVHDTLSGAITLNAQTWISLMMGRPSGSGSVVVHEIMHRGFAIILRTALAHDNSIISFLPNELFSTWWLGWGGVGADVYPPIDVNGDGRLSQVNPEHCMIYSMTEPPNGFYDQTFVQGFLQTEQGRNYFTPQWHSSFNDNYDDLTRDTLNSNADRMRTYWRTLYYNTERGLSRYLRTVLKQPPNITSSPRPRSRPNSTADQ